jgi:hypothetical protein
MRLVTLSLAGDTVDARSTDQIAGGLFAQALRADSNLEMDWLWLATQVQTDDQRAYCLQRALHVNQRSALAMRGLAQLRRRPGKPLEF